jgi:hypothetical protein
VVGIAMMKNDYIEFLLVQFAEEQIAAIGCFFLECTFYGTF